MHVPPLNDHGNTCSFSMKRLFTRSPPCTTNQTHSPSSDLVDRFVQRADAHVNDVIAAGDDVPMLFKSCCDSQWTVNGPSLDPPPAYVGALPQYNVKDEFMTTIANTIDAIDAALRTLSLRIHDNPELSFKEYFAHDILTEFIESHGFTVTRRYLGLGTAWRAEFTHDEGGRTIGINSEMDALPSIGHACGHNLIAVSGVGVAIAIKSALVAHDVSGKVVLLGTPAEERGSGKVLLLERGGYDGMDACLMCHPAAGPLDSVSTGSSLAVQRIQVEFVGHPAHAGSSPWEGVNALDAAFLAYSNVAVLRQQIKPDHRISGVMQNSEFTPNVIPDLARMVWMLRAPDRVQLQTLRERVEACFKGASIATGCRLNLKVGNPIHNLRQNAVLGRYLSQVMSSHFGTDARQDPIGASTDFGNVAYALPALHPIYAIPTQPNGGNHTPAFAVSARSIEAHKACMKVTKGLAWTGFLVLTDDTFYAEVKDEYERTVGGLGVS